MNKDERPAESVQSISSRGIDAKNLFRQMNNWIDDRGQKDRRPKKRKDRGRKSTDSISSSKRKDKGTKMRTDPKRKSGPVSRKANSAIVRRSALNNGRSNRDSIR
jgi:hypothetical protein